MAQIAIPLVLLGTAYLTSNNNSNQEEEEEENGNVETMRGRSRDRTREGMGNMSSNKEHINYVSVDKKNDSPFFARSDDFYPAQAYLSLGRTSRYEDSNLTSSKDVLFLDPSERGTISGNNNGLINDNYDSRKEMLRKNNLDKMGINPNAIGNETKHNNMVPFYSRNTYGGADNDYTPILDSFTGAGTLHREKREVGSMFKPEENISNPYHMENKTDFMRSRVVAPRNNANVKPWKEIRVTPGIGLGAEENQEFGYDSSLMNRDSYMPREVNELRNELNAKEEYTMDEYKGPASSVVRDNRGLLGKVQKHRPDNFYMNSSEVGVHNVGIIPGFAGPKAYAKRNVQNVGETNRDTTSTSYYGVKGTDVTSLGYQTSGEYSDPHRQQLYNDNEVNVAPNGVHPVEVDGYRRSGYNAYANNRSTTQKGEDYVGILAGAVKNVLNPFINGIKHSKKTNTTETMEGAGNVGGYRRSMMVEGTEQYVPTTNKDMYDKHVALKHMNVQGQETSSTYVPQSREIGHTNRETTSKEAFGPAQTANAKAMTNYSSKLTQTADKVYAKNVTTGGGLALFNNHINAQVNNSEQVNTHIPSGKIQTTHRPNNIIGQFASGPQEHKNAMDNRIDNELLDAFRSNPYTQPLDSYSLKQY